MLFPNTPKRKRTVRGFILNDLQNVPLSDHGRRPLQLGSERQLKGVMVWATGDPHTFFEPLGEWEPKDHKVTIRDCNLHPPLVVASRGDTLVLENEGQEPFMVQYGGNNFNEGIVRGSPRRIPLTQGGVQAIHCGFGIPCGRSDVIVVYHPVHSISVSEGHFELNNIPPDQDIELQAWHPLLQETKTTVRVGAGETREVDIIIRARSQVDPAPNPENESEQGSTSEP